MPKKTESKSLSPRKRTFMPEEPTTPTEIKNKELPKKKATIINPHIIIDNIPLPKKSTIDHDSRFRVTENKKILKNRGKQTISYLDQKIYEEPVPLKVKDDLTKSKAVFRDKQKKFILSNKIQDPQTSRNLKEEKPRLASQNKAEKSSI